jgi:hypothetical protein
MGLQRLKFMKSSKNDTRSEDEKKTRSYEISGLLAILSFSTALFTK